MKYLKLSDEQFENGHDIWTAPSRRIGGLEDLGDGGIGERWSEYGASAIVRLLLSRRLRDCLPD